MSKHDFEALSSVVVTRSLDEGLTALTQGHPGHPVSPLSPNIAMMG
ncbi:MAG: hypothetical protein JW932_09745 [Deltaproteobacteria bacterium]|nr:hypothetical protein [Deltaproteobacteria bacterium]